MGFSDRRADTTISRVAAWSRDTGWRFPAGRSRSTTTDRAERAGRYAVVSRDVPLPDGADADERDRTSQVAELVRRVTDVVAGQESPPEILVASRSFRRDYENSEGVRLGRHLAEAELYAEWPDRVVTRRAGDVAQAWSLMEPFLRAGSTPACVPFPAGAPILLPGAVAGILWHEIVGHGGETREVAGGAIAPRVLDVHVRPAYEDGFDDEGRRPDRTCLVSGGVLCFLPAGRRPGRDGGTGHSVAAPHSERLMPRLAMLDVRSRTSWGSAPAPATGEPLVVCLETGGARFDGVTATMEVTRAALSRAGQPDRPVEPFRLRVTAAQLDRSLVATGGPAEGVLGWCTRDGETVPTLTSSPGVLLTDVRPG